MKRTYGFSFSWKRLIGFTAFRQGIARGIGVPTTKQGFQRKVGSMLINLLFGKSGK